MAFQTYKSSFKFPIKNFLKEYAENLVFEFLYDGYNDAKELI